MRNLLLAVSVGVTIASAPVVRAAEPPAPTATPAPTDAPAGTGPLKSLNLGLAVGVDWNVGSDRVSSADVVNGVVRVSNDNNTNLAIVGEAHYFLHPGGTFWGVDSDHWGVGPFLAAEVTDSTLKSFGVGAMLGLKPIATGDHAITFGLGVAWTPGTQVLGDGVFANRPLPAGETTIRFKTTTTTSLMLVVGTTF